MGIFKRGLHSLAKKAAVLTLDNPEAWRTAFPSGTYSGARVTEETLLEVAVTWSCIRLISETIGTLPIHLYKKTDNGREKAIDHPLYRLVHTQPNRFMTSVEWRESMAVSLCVWGHAYSMPERLGGEVVSIMPMPKPNVSVRVENGEPVYTVTDNGKQTEYAFGDLLSIKGFGGAGQLEGFAPYKYARQSVALTAAAEIYGAKFFGGGGRTKGFLQFETFLKPEQRAAAKEMMESLHGSLDNALGLGVLEGGVNYIPGSSQNNEAQFIETRKFQIAEACRVWRVPLSMVMEMDKATFNNTEQENIRLLQYTLRPYLVRIEQALNIGLLTRKDQRDHYFEFNVEGLLRGDIATRGAWYKSMREVGAMTPNQIAELENLPTYEGGDDHHMPLNMAPVDQVRSINDGKTNG